MFIVIPLADYLVVKPKNMKENKARVVSEEFYLIHHLYLGCFQFSLLLELLCYCDNSLTTFESIAFTFSFCLLLGG